MDLRLKEPERHKAVLVDAVAGRERFLEAMFMDRGILIVERYERLGEIITLHSLPACDLIIAYLDILDEAACRAIRAASEKFGRALLVITEAADVLQIANAVLAGADSVLPIGAAADRLKCAATIAIAAFERTGALRRAVEDAEEKLADRKLIERAKGILMTQRGIAETEAFRELQTVSMRQNRKLPDVARRIIEAKELLG
jgi:response regulator NasT